MVESFAVRKRKTQEHWNRYNCAPAKVVSESYSQRVYAIRLALGDGWKSPLPMAEFAALLGGAGGGTRYDSSVISRIENGERKLTLADVERIAAVDPERRGKLWLGWGELADSTMAEPEPLGVESLTPEREAEIRQSRAAKRAARNAESEDAPATDRPHPKRPATGR